MRLSTKGRYAVMAMVDLAKHAMLRAGELEGEFRQDGLAELAGGGKGAPGGTA